MGNNQHPSVPLVSFIVTTYNLPVDLLIACIDSILRLSLSPEEREIIVVDDGSDESPLNPLLKYGDDITYVRQANKGLSTARNLGIEMSKGRYLQFVDGDDQLIPSGFDACLTLLRQHMDADMVLFDFNEHPNPQATVGETPQSTSGTSYMRHNNIHGMACGYLVRRTTLSELRFTPGLYHEDELFTPQLLIRAEVVYPTTIKAYYYNKRPNSIVTCQDAAHVERRQHDLLQIIRELNRMADRMPKNDQLAMNRRVAQLTMDYLYLLMMQRTSPAALDNTLQLLRQEGLFPLPNQPYSSKYIWFRRLSSLAIGRKLLLTMLPLLKKER